jgi:hypothetical protein
MNQHPAHSVHLVHGACAPLPSGWAWTTLGEVAVIMVTLP